MKKWHILSPLNTANDASSILEILLSNRKLSTATERKAFLHPQDPLTFEPEDVGIDPKKLLVAIKRIEKAIKDKESIVVYADYDADGITAGAIMWETIHALGGKVMPYIPHRVEEGYGLSTKGIEKIKEDYAATLIVTVDHGITAYEKVEFAKNLGIDVVVTDHHSKPEKLPDCPIVHTTAISGSGVSWYVAMRLLKHMAKDIPFDPSMLIRDHLSLTTIGTIADLLPLVGPNRSIVKYGLSELSQTRRIGLVTLIKESGIVEGANITAYDVSHVLAPRLNAMGRLEHAMDALRLLCTKKQTQADELATKLTLTNKERQQLTVDSVLHAKTLLPKELKKLIFVSHESYNQGVIGLVAGKLTEEYYRPSVIVAIGSEVSKASARSISGFNIVEAIRTCQELLLEVGGHPMAAGFSVETKNLTRLQEMLEQVADTQIDEDTLKRVLTIDCEISLNSATESLWYAIQDLAPFGFGNWEPVFATTGVKLIDARLIGNGGKHLKLKVSAPGGTQTYDAVGFGMGELYPTLHPDKPIDIAYTVDINEWNGRRNLQLKVRDIRVSS